MHSSVRIEYPQLEIRYLTSYLSTSVESYYANGVLSARPFFAATPIIVARVCAALSNALYSAARNETRIPTDASFHSINEK
jgi:hypothetical protein